MTAEEQALKGHVFVVHGKVNQVLHDAVVVPTDEFLTVEPHWRDLIETEQPPRPTTWAKGWGRHRDTRCWLVDVTDLYGVYDTVLDRLEGAVEDIARSEDLGDPRGRRALPLVAVPVLGIGKGGYDGQQGRVLTSLIARLTDLASTHQLDIALVAANSSVYHAAQNLRRKLDPPLPEFEARAKALGKRAKHGELALFLGAGISIPAGLPSWEDLIKDLAEEARLPHADLTELTPIDQAELIEHRAEAEAGSQRRVRFQQSVAKRTSKAAQPALLHALIAGLDIRQAATTNYDTLYEQAMEAAGHPVAAILPWASGSGADRWVLKLHGDREHPEQIVLTRRHMVRYDAANRPSAALLQSLFLTHHLLVIGASMTDDNVIRLAHEVQAYREDHHQEQSEFGTVLHPSNRGRSIRAQLWEGQLDWVHLPPRRRDGCLPGARNLPRSGRTPRLDHVGLVTRSTIRRPAGRGRPGPRASGPNAL